MDKREYLNKHAVLLEELEGRGIDVAEYSFPIIEESWNPYSDNVLWQNQIKEMEMLLGLVWDW